MNQKRIVLLSAIVGAVSGALGASLFWATRHRERPRTDSTLAPLEARVGKIEAEQAARDRGPALAAVRELPRPVDPAKPAPTAPPSTTVDEPTQVLADLSERTDRSVAERLGDSTTPLRLEDARQLLRRDYTAQEIEDLYGRQFEGSLSQARPKLTPDQRQRVLEIIKEKAPDYLENEEAERLAGKRLSAEDALLALKSRSAAARTIDDAISRQVLTAEQISTLPKRWAR